MSMEHKAFLFDTAKYYILINLHKFQFIELDKSEFVGLMMWAEDKNLIGRQSV